MNSQIQKSRKINPRQNANLFSRLFLSFAFKTIWKGNKRELRDDDIFEVLNFLESKPNGDRLEIEWKKELDKKNPSLLYAMFRIFGFKYFVLSVFTFVYETVLITILEPLLIGKVTSYFEVGTNMTAQEGALYVFGLTATSVLFCLCNNIFYLTIITICLKARIAVTSLMYRKSLKLNLNESSNCIEGRVVNLITKDIALFFDAADYAQMFLVGTPQYIVLLIMVYNQIGVAAVAAMLIIMILIPVNILLGKLASKYRLRTAFKTDQRVKVTKEILTAIRIIKMYTWELFFSKAVHKLRSSEIRNLKILFYIKAVALSIGHLSSQLIIYVCVVVYSALGNRITAEQAFVVISCFGAVRGSFTTYMPLGVAQLADMKASLQRITKFLMSEEIQKTEILDQIDEVKISVKNMMFGNTNNLVLFNNLTFEAAKGLIVITGPMGCGKSIILKALLGDVVVGGQVNVSGKISYASQEPWLFPATVRQNILFGEAFNKSRYEQVIDACALRKDIECLPNGDKTLVTDCGLNLSKGQKARINLARAVYKQTDVYLIDDSLSSVDSTVGNHIFEKCIKAFLKGRLIVFVTHNSNFMSLADDLIVLGKGTIQYHGNYTNFKNSTGIKLNELLIHNQSAEFANVSDEYMENDPDNANELSTLLHKSTEINENIYEEFNEAGCVNKKVYYEYLSSAGGFKVFLIIFATFVVSQAFSSWSDYFVSFWVDTEQELTNFHLNNTINTTEYMKLEESHDKLMKLYTCVMIATATLTFFSSFVFFIFSSKASTNLHNLVLDKILNSEMTFFDGHLSGNVLNRFSQDLGIIDDNMPGTIYDCISCVVQVLAVFLVVSSVNLYFIIPSIVFTILLYFARRLYIPAGRSLRRLEGSSRSPVIGHLNATLEGLTTIRASQKQSILLKEFDKHQDLYSSVAYMNIEAIRAFVLYIDLTCACYIAIITLAFLFLKDDTLAGKVGLAITQSFLLTSTLQWGITSWALLENQMTSTERVLHYKKVDVENKSGKNLNNFPSDGSITYTNVCLSYNSSGEKVLNDLCFNILSKEKVGIVGRTGAGKTSIISTLFRMYDFEGTIAVDGVDIKTLSIDQLRSKMSIIPQDPILFSGTIRSNLDPYMEYSDEAIWSAINEVGIKDSVKSLDKEIYEGGSDFSVGEKQLFCLARAVLRNNSILILDEATANVDAETDALIQKTIKKLFSNCTVITIAHKLNTVLDSDKILVMDSGKMIQFGPPQDLLYNPNGLFYTMVKDSGLI